MFRDDNNHPAPYIPAEALQRPVGAVVDAAGQVTCVVCRATVPLAKADVVGMGYRCQPCSHRAELALLTGGGDAASHFSQAERAGLSQSGLHLIYGGLIAMVAGVGFLGFLFLKLGVIMLVGGGAMIGTGLARRNAAH